MDNLRQFERFPLNLPVRAEVYTPDKKQVFDLKTKDISASGAFVFTPEQFPNSTNIKLNLVVPNGRIKQLTNAQSLIDCEGQVVRFTAKGVAIHFIMDCKIMSLTEA
jgi:hypothetical protein